VASKASRLIFRSVEAMEKVKWTLDRASKVHITSSLSLEMKE